MVYIRHHDEMFQILAKNRFNPVFLRFLEFWYKSSRAMVRWKSVVSSKLLVSNGVRQGGKLSPLL